MFGLNKQETKVGASGNKDAEIILVGEAPGAEEARAGRPFVGSAGKVLDSCLQNAGIVRANCYITNVVKTRPHKNLIYPWFNDKTGLTEKGRKAADDLIEELRDCKGNIIVALGRVASAALLGRHDITKIRGYVFPCSALGNKKVIPTIHPASTLRGNYIQRYYIVNDLKKAKTEKDFPQLSYPERTLIARSDITFSEAMELLDFVESHSMIAFDIEIVELQISCISFATSPDWAFSLPLYKRWSEAEEAQLFKRVADILSNPEIIKIGQNHVAFDNVFCAQVARMLITGEQRDIMIAHSIMYPDMLKSLGFLASIYTNERYWKDMVSFKTDKKED